MKTRLLILSIAAAIVLGIAPRTHAAVEFSAGIDISAPADFYAPLQPYGTWVDLSGYGRCWHPAQVERDWRPYTVGYWEWTDAGWYWDSDEPWAWACYHYGTWYYDANYGWVWIPGTEWAPAWVSWRYGGDYVGWAPCGPNYVVLAPSFFCFVDTRSFRHHFHPRDLVYNNPRIIEQTRVVNGFQRETREINGTRQTMVVNNGPGLEPIQRATGAKLTPRPITEVIRQTRVPETLRQREDRQVRPTTQQSTTTQPSTTQQTQPGTVEQPRERTGREQQRTYERPQSTAPEQTSPRQTMPRERLPQAPSTVTPSEQPKPAPERPREVLPPTGNEQRQYREVPTPAPEQPRTEQPVPRESRPEQRVVPPANVPERPLPPTSREVPNVPSQRPEMVPPQRPVVPVQPQVPARPQVPPGQDRDRDRQF